MGVGGISIWQLLIVLVIVLLLFGTKKLRNMGGDLGGAIKGFRSSMKEVKGADESSDQKPRPLKRTMPEHPRKSRPKKSDRLPGT